MATSVSVSPDNAVGLGGLDVDESRPENGKQMSGRRKPKPNEKKKQPRRGMGVAQLERLRFQERWKKLSTHNNPLLLPHDINPHTHDHFFVPASSHDLKSFVVSSYGNGVGVNQSFLLPKLENGGLTGFSQGQLQLQAESYGFGYSNYSGSRAGNVAHETSNELSSIPNVNCYYGQYNHCYKETEVLAVHRKESSRGSAQCGRVLMEYEFFPGKLDGCRGPTTCSHDHMEPGSLQPEGSVGVTAVDDDRKRNTPASNSAAAARFGASNSVDLSLKLSY